MKDGLLVRARGKIILVQNLTNIVKLILPMDPTRAVLQTLQWFLEELKKDLQSLRDFYRPRAIPASSSGDRKDELQRAREEQLVDGMIEGMLAHPQCLKALWLPSRNCFRIRKRNLTGKDAQRDFFARRGPHFWASLQQAGDNALGFLDCPDAENDAGSDDDELAPIVVVTGTEPGREPGEGVVPGTEPATRTAEEPGEGEGPGPGHSGNLDVPAEYELVIQERHEALDQEEEELARALQLDEEEHEASSRKKARSGSGAGKGLAPDIVD